MATIDLDGVHKRYGRVTALDGVSFGVKDGEFFCVLGPSGAGKTTTLKAIAGLEQPDGGQVRVGGVDVGDVEPTHRNLAMCFEGYALYPQLDVYGNIGSPLRSPQHRTPQAELDRRVRKTAAGLGIDHLLNRSVTQLSNGQRQRVALARVLVRPASAYLLDEPLAHLDAKLRAHMRAELRALSRDAGTTTVYVTHDYVEALSLADRIAVLRQGRILQSGTPEEIWQRPANVFVARAFGKPRISLVEGALVAEGDGEGSAFRGAGGAIRVPLGRGVAARDAVLLGVRARDLHLHRGAGDPPAGHARLAGSVYVLEQLGRQVEVTVQVGQERLSVLLPRDHARDLALDDTVTLTVDPAKVLVFAPGETGERIHP